MDLWLKILRGALLGALQGLTEFLPVSSSGHLLLAERLGVAAPDLALNLLLHTATLAAVLLLLRKDVFEMIRRPFSPLTRFVLLATLPTGIIGVLVSKFFPTLLEGALLAPCFLFTALLLLLPSPKKEGTLTPVCALVTGFAQGIAVLPGVSRSGATLAALRLQGINEEQAVKISFLLSVPVIMGGALVEFFPVLTGAESVSFDWAIALPACLVAFLVGALSLRAMLKVFRFQNALPFSLYLFVLSILAVFI